MCLLYVAATLIIDIPKLDELLNGLVGNSKIQSRSLISNHKFYNPDSIK